MKKEGVYGVTSYVLGIVSVVLAFFQPFPGLILGLVGLSQSKKEKSNIAKEGRKLSIWGIVLSLIIITISIGAMIYAIKTGQVEIPNLAIK